MNSLDIFKILHAEIHNEHSLISNRMNWYVTSQSFLMTAFAIAGGENYQYHWLAQWLIPVLGILVSFLIWCSILAGLFAMRQLRREEFTLLQNDPFDGIPFGKIPRVIHNIGMTPPAIIPIIFVGVWTVAWIFAHQ